MPRDTGSFSSHPGFPNQLPHTDWAYSNPFLVKRFLFSSLRYVFFTLMMLITFVPKAAFSQIIVNNLKAPQSIVSDPGEGYFIANANGDPGNRDNHGFITKLDQEGQIVDLHFIQGGQGNTVLHSPTGMVLVNTLLYVADLDTVRGFDKTTGEPIQSVSLSRYNCTSLAGLTADSEGQLLVSDMETNAIYRIDPNQEYAVSLLVQDASLSGPRGLAIHPRSRHVVGVGRNNGKIFEIDEKGTITELLANSFFSRRFHNLEGIDFDQYGSMYVSDITAGKVWRIRADLKKEVIAEFLVSPAGISVDRKNHLILVPYLYANGAEINGLERPVNTGQKRKPRTLSDYYDFGRSKKE